MRQPRPWRRASKSNAWFAQVGGKQRFLAPTTATKDEAQKELYRILAESKEAAHAASRPLSTADVLRHYMAAYRARVEAEKASKPCYNNCAWFLQRAEADIGMIPAADLRAKDVLAWATRPGWKESSKASAVKKIKSAFRFAVELGYLDINPIAGIRTPTAKRRMKIPTEAQSLALIEAATSPFREVLWALLETGCRPKEVFGLTADRVNLDARTWLVQDKNRFKSGEEWRTIYLSESMLELSRRQLERFPEGLIFRNSRGAAWNQSSVSNRLINIRTKLGLGPEVVAYACRHRFATRALVNGVPMATVAALMGHTSATHVLRAYSHLLEETGHLHEAAERAGKKVS